MKVTNRLSEYIFVYHGFIIVAMAVSVQMFVYCELLFAFCLAVDLTAANWTFVSILRAVYWIHLCYIPWIMIAHFAATKREREKEKNNNYAQMAS